MDTDNRTKALTIFGIILGASMIASALIGAGVFYKIKSYDNALSVTGSAKREVTSDKVKWTSSITRTARISGLKGGYAQLSRDLADVKAFFKEKGIPDESIIISPVFMNENWQQYATAETKEYNLTQTFEIQSDDVEMITQVSKNIQTVIDKGIIFQSNAPEYYYSKLPEMRVELLSDALADAKNRAAKLAESTGGKVGALKSASSGVVQVLTPNSTQVSDYGSYDTSKIQKEIMVTVKASFTVK
jgi:hypothetical protein